MERTNKFMEMDVKKEIKKAIANMGFEEATPIQKEAIPAVISGKDFIGIAQTGTGKTCAFGVPVIEMVDTKQDDVQALILCPTRELAVQTGQELQNLGQFVKGLRMCTVYGGQQIERQIMALKKKPQIIIGTPGRVMDHIRRRTLKLANIKMFILDEADEMLNMGFRPDLDYILENANETRQTVLFSATMSKDILKITKKYLRPDAEKIEIEHKTITSPNIEQYLLEVKSPNKTEVLCRILDAEEIKLSVIFCNTKRKVDELVDDLTLRGYQVGAIHGDMKQNQRDAVMKKFKTEKINILIATDVAARGIDIDNIEVVFNYDIPSDEEYYVHRIGRTGRAGKKGKSISFITNREKGKIKDIQRYTNAKMDRYEVPSIKFVNQKKVNNLLNKVAEEIANEELANEIEILETFLESSEVNMTQVAAALIKMKLGKTLVKKEIEVEEMFDDDSDSRSRRGNEVRLFITLGKMDGMRRNELKDYLISESGIKKTNILNVETLDKFSFVKVTSDVADKVIKKLDNTKLNGRKVSVEVSTGKGSSSSRGRGSRSRSRR